MCLYFPTFVYLLFISGKVRADFCMHWSIFSTPDLFLTYLVTSIFSFFIAGHIGCGGELAVSDGREFVASLLGRKSKASVSFFKNSE